MRLLQCESLQASDIYFDKILTSSSNLNLLGDIELNDEELKHLTKLISKELRKINSTIKDSLSIAVFLVWMGILHYRDNFWTPVYRALELPDNQVKWQRILGETFIQTVKKYKFPIFEGKQRYVTPILAHGYVPNYFLNSYFSDVVMALYIEHKKASLYESLVNLDEVRHIVSNWRREYTIYQNLMEQKTELENQEESIVITLELLKSKDNLVKLNELKNELRQSDELNKLLAMPENWLEHAEEELNNVQEACTILEKAYESVEAKKAKLEELCELNQKIEIAAAQVLDYWDEIYIDPVLKLPIEDIETATKEFSNIKRMFYGIWGWILRFVLWWRYKQAEKCKHKLANYLSNLPVKSYLLEEPQSVLPEGLRRIQGLIKIRREIEGYLEDLDKAGKEIAAHNLEMTGSQQLSLYKEQLSRLKNDIAEYKMNLVKLGKGSLEKGIEELNKQRSIRREIESIKGKISSQIGADTLLEKLNLLENNTDEFSLRSKLLNVRKQEEEFEGKIERYNKPLYTLNESTRTFLLEGEDLSVKFIFNSMLLMQKLEQGDADIKDISLPPRIICNMEKWWHQYGKEMLNEADQRWEWRESGDITLRRPVIKLDTFSASIKAELPQQLVREMAKTVFVIRGESGVIWKKEVSVKRIKEDQFQTDHVEVDLEQPECSYTFEFMCGEIYRSWGIKGLDNNKLCLLFNSRKELIENEQLPGEEAYIVVPTGSRIEPSEVVKERRCLRGYWSEYEYCYLQLKNVDMVLVESGTKVALLKQKIKLEPRLIGGNKSTYINVKDNIPVYIGRLPEIVFTPDNLDELSLYGVRLDYSDATHYLPLEKLGIIHAGKDVYLPLSAIAEGTTGFCKASLIYKQSVIWSKDFILLPYTELHFDQDIYYPQMGKEEMGQLEIISNCPFSFSLYSTGAFIESSRYKVVIKFDIRQLNISGKLCYSSEEGENFELDVYVEIPNIRWRKDEADNWKVEVEELWYEELGEIQLRLPPFITGFVTLALEDNRQVISILSKHEIINSNLRQFSDTLRETNKPVHTLTLVFEDKRILPFPLVRIRTCWSVEELKMEQELQGDIRTLSLEWKELGKAKGRVVRFWPLNMSEIRMFEHNIPDGDKGIVITRSRDKFPAGLYRLQFTVDDPWSEDEVLLPIANSESCFDVMIGSKDEVFQDVFENGLTIVSFEEKGKKFPAGRKYWIQDISLSPEFEGDELLKGVVYTVDEEGKPVELNYNPVSFYLESDSFNKLPFLIDRDKDGVMYCVKCRELFWEDAHRECKEHVIFPDYIYVTVRRKRNGFRSFKDN